MKESESNSLQSKEAYSKIPMFFKGVAEEILQRNVSEDLIESWKTLSSAMKAADKAIDVERDLQKREKIENELMHFLRSDQNTLEGDSYLTEQVGELRNSLDRLPQRQKNLFLRNLSLLLNLTESIKSTTSVKDLTRSTRLEGQLTSKLFLSFIPDHLRQNAHYIQLHKTVVKLGRIGNAIDTFFDWSYDYANGQVSLPGSVANKFFLLSGSLKDVPYLLQTFSSHPRRIMDLGRGAIRVASDRKDNLE